MGGKQREHTHSLSVRSWQAKEPRESNVALGKSRQGVRGTERRGVAGPTCARTPSLSSHTRTPLPRWWQRRLRRRLDDTGLEASVYAHGLHGAGFHDVVQRHIPSRQGRARALAVGEGGAPPPAGATAPAERKLSAGLDARVARLPPALRDPAGCPWPLRCPFPGLEVPDTGLTSSRGCPNASSASSRTPARRCPARHAYAAAFNPPTGTARWLSAPPPDGRGSQGSGDKATQARSCASPALART